MGKSKKPDIEELAACMESNAKARKNPVRVNRSEIEEILGDEAADVLSDIPGTGKEPVGSQKYANVNPGVLAKKLRSL